MKLKKQHPSWKNKKTNSTKIVFLFLLFCTSSSLFAQLDSKHYLPPLKQASNNAALREQAIYLATPETATITVNVYKGAATTPWKTVTLSNGTPAEIAATANAGQNIYGGLTNGNNNITLVNDAKTGVVINDAGLRFESAGGEEFYVNYRGRSGAQAASLTCKGTKALGTNFRWGGIPNNVQNHNSCGTTLGIMATEDNTTVTVSGLGANCAFRNGATGYHTGNTSMTITLNAGESYVFEAPINKTINGTALTAAQRTANRDDWLGASIISDKNIAISNGGLNFGIRTTSNSRDAGIDQPVPVSVLQEIEGVGDPGLDYVFVRGKGTNETEFPIIVATEDNTQISVNGSVVATINDGEYYVVNGSNYSGTVAGSNMLVHTSKASYAYQCLAATQGIQTVGMNYIAPVNCLLPKTLNEVPKIHRIAGDDSGFSAITIIASTSTLDANISVTDGNGAITLPASQTVAGTTLWKTFYVTKYDTNGKEIGLTGEVEVTSTGAIVVGTFMSWTYNGNTNGGLAGYFSGFDTVPTVPVTITGGGCFPGSILETGVFDQYQWYETLPDGTTVELTGETNQTLDPANYEEGDFYVRVNDSGCWYESNVITLYNCCDAAYGNVDTDGDGVADICDLDADNDGILNEDEPTHCDPQTPPYSNITGNGQYRNQFLLFDWGNAVIDASNTTITTSKIYNGVTYTATATYVPTGSSSGSSLTPSLIKTWAGGGNEMFWRYANYGDGADDNLKGVLASSTGSGTEVHFKITVYAEKNGVKQAVNVIVFDAESTGSSETLIYKSEASEFGLVDNINGAPDSTNGVSGIGTNTLEYVDIDSSQGHKSLIAYTRGATVTITGELTTRWGSAIGVGIWLYCDTDNDGIPNYLDPDSDGDGCNDADEAYNNSDTDEDNNGFYGNGIPTVSGGTVNSFTVDGEEGKVIAAPYTSPHTITVTDPNDASATIDASTFLQGVTTSFTQQPIATTKCAGETATFTATPQATIYPTTPTTTATTQIDYQWQIDTGGGNFADVTNANTGATVTGASGTVASGTSVTLTLTNVTQSGTYRIVFTNPANVCEEISEEVTLTVNEFSNNISSSSGFKGGNICKGGQGTLSFDAENDDLFPYTIEYKDEDNGTIHTQTIATQSSFTFNVATNPTTVGQHNYTLLSITNKNGCKRTTGINRTNAVITIRENPSLVVTTTVNDNDVCVGDTSPVLTFSNSDTKKIVVTYNLNGGTNQTIEVDGGGSATINVPTGTAGVFTYTATSVKYKSSPNCEATINQSVCVAVFPNNSTAPTVNSGTGTPIVVTPPTSVTGFNIEYSFDDGTTWGSNTPPTSENCTGYKIKTRYKLTGSCANAATTMTCATSSATTRIVDTTAPTFTTPTNFAECVNNIQNATYNTSTSDITPERPDYYEIAIGSTELNLTNLADNCCSTSSLTIHWNIVGTSYSGTGQPSDYGSIIRLELGTDKYAEESYTINYTITDCNGNTSNQQTATITIKPRPKIE